MQEVALIRSPRHLRVVPSEEAAARPPEPGSGDRGDLAVMAMLLGVNLVPLIGAALTRGGWGAGTLGLATAGALVTGRELVLGAVRRARSGASARSPRPAGSAGPPGLRSLP